MIETTLAGHRIKFIDDISELPIVRFQKYCKYSLYESGIGSDLDSVLDHIQRAATLVRSDPSKAITELTNMQNAIYMVANEVNPALLGFACFIVEMDGNPCNDLSEEGIKHIADMLRNEKVTKFYRAYNSVKKKIEEDMEVYFPKEVDNSRDIQQTKILRDRVLKETERIIAICDARLSGKEIPDMKSIAKEIERMDAAMIMLNPPVEFSGDKAADLMFQKNFETTCISLTRWMGKDAKELTTLEFYQAYEDMVKEAKEAKRRQRR